jgi:hypothetical protein
MSRNTKSVSSLTHVLEIQEDHLKHPYNEVSNNIYFNLQQLKFNPALLVLACQDVTFQTNTISDKFLSTIQKLQVKQVSKISCKVQQQLNFFIISKKGFKEETWIF